MLAASNGLLPKIHEMRQFPKLILEISKEMFYGRRVGVLLNGVGCNEQS